MTRTADRGVGALLALVLLLVLPSVAGWPLLQRFGVEWILLPAALSTLSFALYAFDKRRAARGGPRTSEAQLLALDALGGWPGGFVAQQLLRHKNAKATYQLVFWLIIAVHEAAAAWWLFG